MTFPGRISLDESAFDPKRIQAIRHDLDQHPLLQLDALRALALRLPAKQVRFHATTARPGSSFERAAEEHKHHIGLEDALADIETSGSWIALHNVQSDPQYKALIDQVLGDIDQRVGHKDPGMFNRAFWIFLQSPGSVTPFHMDHESNFLMQLRGRKEVFVWYPEDTLSDYALELFHAKFTRKEVVYDDSFEEKAERFIVGPGDGAYMPATCPHMVKNLDNVSLTVAMTYCTAATHQNEAVNRGNHVLRRLGLKPPKVGASPARDAVLGSLYRSFRFAKDRMQGAPRGIPDWARV